MVVVIYLCENRKSAENRFCIKFLIRILNIHLKSSLCNVVYLFYVIIMWFVQLVIVCFWFWKSSWKIFQATNKYKMGFCCRRYACKFYRINIIKMQNIRLTFCCSSFLKYFKYIGLRLYVSCKDNKNICLIIFRYIVHIYLFVYTKLQLSVSGKFSIRY